MKKSWELIFPLDGRVSILLKLIFLFSKGLRIFIKAPGVFVVWIKNEVLSLFNKNGEWKEKILGISKSIVEFKIIKQLRQKENMKDL